MLKRMAGGAAGAAIAAWAGRQTHGPAGHAPWQARSPGQHQVGRGRCGDDGKLTDYKDASTYNNFYEFGTDKADPARNAHTLKTTPWTVEVEGSSRSRANTALKICSSSARRKSASTACAAWKAGPWSSRGWAIRWPS